MRKISPKIIKVAKLKKEFDNLKKELFGNDIFVVLDESSEKTKRYQQLLGFFYPNHRTKDWKNPMKYDI